MERTVLRTSTGVNLVFAIKQSKAARLPEILRMKIVKMMPEPIPGTSSYGFSRPSTDSKMLLMSISDLLFTLVMLKCRMNEETVRML